MASKAVLFPNFAGIPQHVQALDQWLVWAEEEVGGRPTKVPYVTNAPGMHASTSDPRSWSTYADTKRFYLGHKSRLAGVGWCRAGNVKLFDGDGFFRPLLADDVRENWAFEQYGVTFAEWPGWKGKQPREWYLALVMAQAWMELSPSKLGLHAALWSDTAVAVASFQVNVPGLDHCGVALYTGNRYVTVTGATLQEGNPEHDSRVLLEQMPLWLPAAADARERERATVTPEAKQQAVDGFGSDEDVIARVKKDRKGSALWAGGDPGGLVDASPSGLDLALCSRIVFYGGKDPARVDRIFRQSGLMRDKWEQREDYRERTIALAMEMVTDTYKPGPRRAKAKAASASGNGSSANGASSDAADNGSSGADEPPPAGADEPADAYWWAGLKTGKGGVVMCCHFNADLALRNFPEWKAADIVLDEFANVIRSRSAMPWGAVVKSWTDADSVRAAIWMQGRNIPITPGIMGDVVHAWADEHRVHPLREWLASLQWDGEERIDRWTSTYLGAEETPHNCLAGAWWLGGAVARAFVPGAKVDYTLVLEGEQGLLKSTALRTLVGDEWFSDSIASFSGKDSAIDLQGKWVIELGEIDKLAENPSVIKAFLTRVTDHFRPPYEKHSRDFPRQTVFAGTVNLEEYLSDSSGNRRFWPVKCAALDLAALASDREQIWAEAVERYRDNKAIRWPSTPSEIALFGGEVAKREDIDVWHDTIRKWVENPVARIVKEGGNLNPEFRPAGPMDSTPDIAIVSEILLHPCETPIDKQTQALKKRVGQTMRRLGWKPGWAGEEKTRYRVWLRPVEKKP